MDHKSTEKAVIAVLDLGKTNKKVVLVDRSLHVVAELAAELPATASADGLLEENVDGIAAFFTASLRELAANWKINGIGISCHGGTWAGVDANGELAGPVIAYDSPISDQENLDKALYAKQPLLQAQAETGTCDLPLLINPAKGILRLQQQRPEQAAKTHRIQHYPAFWAGKLSGNPAAERTYAFNHSFLHALPDGTPSTLARALGVTVPTEWVDSWVIAGALNADWQAATGLGAIPVGVGLHDSNAALLPYLIEADSTQDFALLSTGTWCVAMHAVDEPSYAEHEVGKKIIFNVDALGGWQKVSFLMGGQDYAMYHEIIGGDHINDATQTALDALLAQQAGILPGASASLFPDCHGEACANGEKWSLEQLVTGQQPAWWTNPATAHHYLNISLALQAAYALQCTEISPETTVYVEGGFRHNPVFLQVLAAYLSPRQVMCTDIGQASALGAGIAAWAGAEQIHPRDLGQEITIDRQPVTAPTLANLETYAQWFFTAAGVEA